jgi:hypothetical protein
MLTFKNKIEAFVKLGKFLQQFSESVKMEEIPEVPLNEVFYEKFEVALHSSRIYNGWFNEEFLRNAIDAIAFQLTTEKLFTWLENYDFSRSDKLKRVGVIMAGNIPLAGFHDFLSVLISGNIFVGKLSSQDKILLPAIAEVLTEIEPDFASRIIFTDGNIKNIDAVIATGSSNSARYFDYYFGKYPNIIRRNRNSVAVITGEETEAELHNLGYDIFLYYGLGCRSVSKIYIPEDYDIDRFFNAIFDFQYVVMNNKYANNYHYNKTLFLLNSDSLLDNEFLILKEDKKISSPVGTLFYERYKDLKELELFLKDNLLTELQCIVSSKKMSIPVVPFGKAQRPELTDYADGVDTVKFLLDIT